MNSSNLALGPFSPIIVIKEGVLLPGRQYTFKVYARYQFACWITCSANGVNGTAQIQLVTANQPNPGKIAVEPESGRTNHCILLKW